MKFNPAYLQVGILTGVELEVLVLLIKWCASLGRAGYGADKADNFFPPSRSYDSQGDGVTALLTPYTAFGDPSAMKDASLSESTGLPASLASLASLLLLRLCIKNSTRNETCFE